MALVIAREKLELASKLGGPKPPVQPTLGEVNLRNVKFDDDLSSRDSLKVSRNFGTQKELNLAAAGHSQVNVTPYRKLLGQQPRMGGGDHCLV